MCAVDKPAKRRLFFGLEIPEPVKKNLLKIRRPLPGARWQRADQLHLTLVFLGSLESQRLPEICDTARNLPIEPFDLTVSGLGCFGPPDHPKNLWAGVQPVTELTALYEALIERLQLVGFEQEKRKFCPHITLSRFKRETASVADILHSEEGRLIGSFRVDRVALFESLQGDHGSIYQIVDRFPLGGPEPY